MTMRVWLYARLSNDDDPAQNSLQNQQEICRAFAEKQGWMIVGSSTDDNISGMNFSRRGLDMLTAAVQAKQVDAVLVKDLSRLGRHRTQTALFIDYLREHQVRVISVTEGVDTFCEEDDLMIGVRGLMNDYYAKDIGKKIRAGYRQKQKDGIVITPPFGYWKDKNTVQIKVDTEAAVTVQLIYSLYLQGCGQKEIARRLNAAGRKTPAQLRAERCGREVRHTHKTRDGQFLWTYASVKNILVEEACTGVLNNHRREYNNGKAKHIDKTDWYRCGTPHLYEEGIKRLFLRAVADLTEDREVLLETCRMIHDEYLNTDTIDAECATLNDEIEIVSGLTKKLIAENATTAIPQDEYNRKYDALVERYHAAQDRLDELQKLRITRSFQADVLECFMFEIKAIDTSLPLEYTDRFWLNLIDRVTVYEDSRLVFRFKNGAKVEETL